MKQKTVITENAEHTELLAMWSAPFWCGPLFVANQVFNRHTYKRATTTFGWIMKSSLLDRITIEPSKCGGRPCIRGMRIRVTDILGLLSSGASHQEILEDYPILEEDDIFATLEYAAAQADHAILIAA